MSFRQHGALIGISQTLSKRINEIFVVLFSYLLLIYHQPPGQFYDKKLKPESRYTKLPVMVFFLRADIVVTSEISNIYLYP